MPRSHRTRSHRSLRLLLPVSFGLLALGAWRLAPQDLDSVVIETQPVAGPVSMLVGAGGNIGVSAGADGIFMIDDQFLDLAPRILTALEALKTPTTGSRRSHRWNCCFPTTRSSYHPRRCSAKHQRLRRMRIRANLWPLG